VEILALEFQVPTHEARKRILLYSHLSNSQIMFRSPLKTCTLRYR